MVIGWVDIAIFSIAAGLLVLRLLPVLRVYRPLFDGGAVLMMMTALAPRTGNPLGTFFFGTTGVGAFLPRELFGTMWWVLGAWLLKSLLDLFLSRTFFPNNDQPHARRLFADLASGLIYVLAFVGIVGTVFKEPVSTLLAGSGVLAIVLGLALQSTLGDILSGLAINIDRPFGAGDWISIGDQISGQVMQVNWRATRLKTWAHDMVVIPNSIVSKAAVTNFSRPAGPHRCILNLQVDLATSPSRVIEALLSASSGSPDLLHGTLPEAYARTFSDTMVEYELAFAIENYALSLVATSHMLSRIADAFKGLDIEIGANAMDVRIVRPGPALAIKALQGKAAG